MPIRRLASTLLASLMVLSAPAGAFNVGVKGVESMEDFQRWFKQKPAPSGVFPTVSTLQVGKKVHLPILVTGLDPQARGPINLVGDLEIVDPTGKVTVLGQCCKFAVAERHGLATAVLGPTINFALDAGDPKGIYTVRATVTDGTRRGTWVEKLSYGTDEKARPASAPREAAVPVARPPTRDRRECLALSTPAEVIRCVEKR